MGGCLNDLVWWLFPTCMHITVWVCRKSSHVEPYVQYRGEKDPRSKTTQYTADCSMFPPGQLEEEREFKKKKKRERSLQCSLLGRSWALPRGTASVEYEEHSIAMSCHKKVWARLGHSKTPGWQILPTALQLQGLWPRKSCVHFPVLIRAAWQGGRGGKNELFHGNLILWIWYKYHFCSALLLPHPVTSGKRGCLKMEDSKKRRW